MNPDHLIAQFGEQQVASFLLVLGRIGPLFLLAPMFSSRMMPARAKSVAAVALAVGIAPVALRTAGSAAGQIPDTLWDFTTGTTRFTTQTWKVVGSYLPFTLDVYGDGVNIAARIESLCEPGGVWLAARVHDQVKGKIEIDFFFKPEEIVG